MIKVAIFRKIVREIIPHVFIVERPQPSKYKGGKICALHLTKRGLKMSKSSNAKRFGNIVSHGFIRQSRMVVWEKLKNRLENLPGKIDPKMKSSVVFNCEDFVRYFVETKENEPVDESCFLFTDMLDAFLCRNE